MSKLPPFLPEETLVRVLRLSRLDGMSVLVIAGLFAVMSALAGDQLGAIVGLLVAGAGAVELHGATLLHHGEPRGLRWLVGSQLFLLATIVGYCALRLLHPAFEPLHAAMTPEMKTSLEAAGWTEDEFVGLVYQVTYAAVATVTCAYQGGMAIFYWRRRQAVTEALAPEA